VSPRGLENVESRPTHPEPARTALDPGLLTRARNLVKISLASATLLALLTLVLPVLLDDASTTDTFFLLWGAFLLLAATIMGVTWSYLYLTRVAGGKPPTATNTPAPPTPTQPLPDVVLRVLTEDEREVIERLRQAGGSLLQKDLVRTRVFTPAKITRILDRLEYKGLVKRERYGMTNRLLLADAWKRPLATDSGSLQHTPKSPSIPTQSEDESSRSVRRQ